MFKEDRDLGVSENELSIVMGIQSAQKWPTRFWLSPLFRDWNLWPFRPLTLWLKCDGTTPEVGQAPWTLDRSNL